MAGARFIETFASVSLVCGGHCCFETAQNRSVTAENPGTGHENYHNELRVGSNARVTYAHFSSSWSMCGSLQGYPPEADHFLPLDQATVRGSGHVHSIHASSVLGLTEDECKIGFAD